MTSHEDNPTGSAEKSGFRTGAVNLGKKYWRWLVFPTATVGALAYATYLGRNTIDFAVDTVDGEETISGLVINRGAQAGIDQRTNPVICDHTEACPVDNTSFIQNKRYFVMIDNCELVLADADTSVQSCGTSTYQTDEDTYNKAVKGTKIEIPGGSKLVAFSSVTK
ncbi:MAG: hypothetical protein AAB512_02275 [Patescibacteria group bacterium]